MGADLRHIVLAAVLELAGRNKTMTVEQLGQVRHEVADFLRNLDVICDVDDDNAEF